MTPPRKRILVTVGLVVGVVAWIAFHEYAEHVEYPMNEWRIDLDDAAVGLGTILVGIAAIWTVWLKAVDAHDRTVELSHRLNGGLAKAAREHVQDNEIIVGLVHRLDVADAARDDCLERYAELERRIDELGSR